MRDPQDGKTLVYPDNINRERHFFHPKFLIWVGETKKKHPLVFRERVPSAESPREPRARQRYVHRKRRVRDRYKRPFIVRRGSFAIFQRSRHRKPDENDEDDGGL